MSTQILIKRSTTTGAVPTAQDIAVGELAINTVDKRIFTNNSGTIVELGTTPSTQAVAGNASVGGTFDVVGAVTVGNFSADGTVDLTSATVTIPAPTADTHPATKKYVDDEVNAILDGAPAALDTLNEIAAAINDDANVFTTLTNSIATKLPLAGGTMTGAIDMGVNGITTSVDPATANTLTRKSYVDGLYQSTVDAEVSAAAAAVSETNAANSATSAASSASTATTQASNASTSATNAATSATNAGNSATSAANSATASATSATQSASSATAAATSETNAATSETNAATSETNAASSATAAASSATAAASSETNAAASETAAASSETNAAASELAAATSASNASTSETNAAASAASAASNASSTASLYDQFDDRYLGSKASAPSVDNDGNALLVGALYFNSSDSSMYSWNGSSWIQVANQSEALQAIATTKADTAVDVFVYDTRKDSDGGAWRKRTQHTSWYNETLNTATRGSRKEFPAVAVIVAEANQVTIYDGDDPALPMWMVFSGANAYFINPVNAVVTSTAMLNGILCVTESGSGGHGLRYANFVSEDIELRSTTHYETAQSIVDRNTVLTNSVIGVATGLVNSSVNDVAMTVLPNAPIDSATGLPVPTIAVATDGGVSVIKDDGTVVDIVHSDTALTPNIWLDGDILTYNANNFYHSRKIPTVDVSAGLRYVANADDIWFAPRYYNPSIYTLGNFNLHPTGGVFEDVIQKDNYVAVRGSDRAVLATLSGNQERVSNDALYAFVTSTYNTGWMNGDIKLATLSDTDTTDVTGTELVTNGTFDSDSDWTLGTNWSITGGKLVCSGGLIAGASQNITTVIGQTYTLSYDIDAIVTGGEVGIVASGLTTERHSTTGTYSATFTATSTTTTISTSGTSTTSVTIDNVSVRLAEEDRSVNGNGLQVFGTVTKEPVATGADLVAYSGFSTSNYLQQPYNSDLDFGTGDFCIIGWFNVLSDNGGYLFERLDTARTGNRIRGYVAGVTTQFLIGDGSGALVSKDCTDGKWHFYTGVVRGGVAYLYIDGILIGSGSTGGNSVTNTSAITTLGVRSDSTTPFAGSLALWRISATAPTAEQIKKIYEDEKVLFQEGAQATLYGSSDAVTALAYDEDTELLHVGTSAGRSDFSGLRRVGNTTDAVGTAISASNGMIVEE